MRSVIPIIKLAADRCELSLLDVMLLSAQTTDLYRRAFADLGPGNDYNEYLMLQSRIKSRLQENLFYKDGPVDDDSAVVNLLATAWSFVSKCAYETYYNAFSNGRFADGIFASKEERLFFVNAMLNGRLSEPVVTVVERRLSRYNPENPQV